MKTLVVWLMFAMPTQMCIDKVELENYSDCRMEEVPVRDSRVVDLNGQRAFILGNTEMKKVCREVQNPKPLPKKKFIVSDDPYEMLDDECYTVYRSSMSLEKVTYSSGVFISTIAVTGSEFILME